MKLSALHIVLAALLVGLALLAALRLQPLIHDFDTVVVPIIIPERPASVGKEFDEIILGDIHAFRYIKSFNHVFQQGPQRHTLSRPVFMDRCEVTQNDYRIFANWIKVHQEWVKGREAPGQPPDWNYTSNTQQHSISGKLSAPSSGVTYFDAFTYCRVAGGRLPTQHDWIAAASGPEQRLYPWGNEFQQEGMPYLDPLLNAAQQCDAHPENATPDGIQDLAGGNVSEWAINTKSPLEPFIMGGNAFNKPRSLYHLNALYRIAPPYYRSPYVGFRCVFDYQPSRTPWNKQLETVMVRPGVYEVGMPQDARLPKFLFNAAPEQIGIIEEFFSQPDDELSGDEVDVMRFEVTRRQYERFLGDAFVLMKIYADKNEPEGHSYRPPDFDRQLEQPDLPVVNVDWWSAYAYSRWAGGRLPRAEEWAVVASSLGQNVYPWGDDAKSGVPAAGAADSGDMNESHNEQFDQYSHGNGGDYLRDAETAGDTQGDNQRQEFSLQGDGHGGDGAENHWDDGAMTGYGEEQNSAEPPVPLLHNTRLKKVGSNPMDVTEQGVMDMGGSVSEWTQSITSQNGKVVIVIKGGNYLLPQEETAMVGFNNFVSPHYRSPTLGFRVVFDR